MEFIKSRPNIAKKFISTLEKKEDTLMNINVSYKMLDLLEIDYEFEDNLQNIKNFVKGDYFLLFWYEKIFGEKRENFLGSWKCIWNLVFVKSNVVLWKIRLGAQKSVFWPWKVIFYQNWIWSQKKVKFCLSPFFVVILLGSHKNSFFLWKILTLEQYQTTGCNVTSEARKKGPTSNKITLNLTNHFSYPPTGQLTSKTRSGSVNKVFSWLGMNSLLGNIALYTTNIWFTCQ